MDPTAELIRWMKQSINNSYWNWFWKLPEKVFGLEGKYTKRFDYYYTGYKRTMLRSVLQKFISFTNRITIVVPDNLGPVRSASSLQVSGKNQHGMRIYRL